jgi:ubiquinone/menaquinone biosynthesis C-methylase UbiE
MVSMAFMDPAAVATHFHVRHGDRVADLGAGSGHFVRVLSRLVGREGKVFAVEIQRQLAQAIADMVQKEHLANVESIWGDIEQMQGTKIADATLDAVIISNTLSMVAERETVVREALRLLRKGGKLLVVDWTDSAGGMGPSSSMIITPQEVTELATRQHAVFEREFPAGDHHYGLSFRVQ